MNYFFTEGVKKYMMNSKQTAEILKIYLGNQKQAFKVMSDDVLKFFLRIGARKIFSCDICQPNSLRLIEGQTPLSSFNALSFRRNALDL